MDTENADTQPSSASCRIGSKIINDVRIVSFIFIDTDADESKNVAFRVALYEPTSGRSTYAGPQNCDTIRILLTTLS